MVSALRMCSLLSISITPVSRSWRNSWTCRGDDGGGVSLNHACQQVLEEQLDLRGDEGGGGHACVRTAAVHAVLSPPKPWTLGTPTQHYLPLAQQPSCQHYLPLAQQPPCQHYLPLAQQPPCQHYLPSAQQPPCQPSPLKLSP